MCLCKIYSPLRLLYLNLIWEIHQFYRIFITLCKFRQKNRGASYLWRRIKTRKSIIFDRLNKSDCFFLYIINRTTDTTYIANYVCICLCIIKQLVSVWWWQSYLPFILFSNVFFLYDILTSLNGSNEIRVQFYTMISGCASFNQLCHNLTLLFS